MAMTSRELLVARKRGAVILHNGAEVEHRPRRAHDRKPWVFIGAGQVVRYSADQCVAHYPKGAPLDGRS